MDQNRKSACSGRIHKIEENPLENQNRDYRWLGRGVGLDAGGFSHLRKCGDAHKNE